ncbi:MAG: phosphatidylglycerol lysyltransferase [Treponema sp.]|jgi:phosphoglucomutase|nr:phosphatidylglycerol lysyltransferase [Treponema sp.]
MDLKLAAALSRMILSPSGWRGVFAEDGDEESDKPEITEEGYQIAATAARAFSFYLKANDENRVAGRSAVFVGMDTRPTGNAIAGAVISALVDEGWEVRFCGIVAAPEIMALARAGSDTACGFVYISASHNPIGHNGLKFGLTDGGVLQAEESNKLLKLFKELLALPQGREKPHGCTSEHTLLLEDVRKNESVWKKAALLAYRDFTEEVVSGFSNANERAKFFAAVREGIAGKPLGIAADFNGSARTVSIDRDFFESLGIGFFAINDKPGVIAHRIVPEGASLLPCCEFLEELREKNPEVVLGYMPDCDGDRGNLVIADESGEGRARARALEAQEVFALACMAELAYLVWSGELKCGKSKVPVVVNDATSLRIDRIAEVFGARIFRAEVGEANVVALARKLRADGYLVRFLGEGSAGGVIVHPSSVRDPLATLGSVLKLLAIRQGGSGSFGVFQTWCELSGQKEAFREKFTLTDVIATLPKFVTTGMYTDDALLKVKTADHGLLKNRYQKIFLKCWEEKKSMLKTEYGILSWEAIAYNGMEEKRGLSCFGDCGMGGLKIEFKGENVSGLEDTIGCIWMRGSGTEPVFRVMADAADCRHENSEALDTRSLGFAQRLERSLIKWQRQMVLEADSK